MSQVKCPPASPRPLDREQFIDPTTEPTLEAYLRNVFQWHGYIQFVSVTSVRENPDVPIAQLYIEPYLASQWVSPDTPEDKWPKCELLTAAIVEHPHLVVLGDPGSGKSTLVSRLAWQLARRKDSPWIPEVDGLVPIPMVLRELGIAPGITWEALLDTFLHREVAKPLKNARWIVNQMLERGQAYLLLDGLDEIGSQEARRSLRDAVFEGRDRFPACRWLLTSRIVGYGEVAFHRAEVAATDAAESLALGAWGSDGGFIPDSTLMPWRRQPGEPRTTYVAPFKDEQIRRYARNWFAQRDLVSERAAAQGEEFIRALYSHKTVTRLARTPYILTLMALIYRVKAKLPHGRALLYHQIAEAYLQTIDEYRKLRELGYPVAQKRRWLARAAFEMQLRRVARPSRSREEEDGQTPGAEILVSQGEVVRWVAEAMGESGYGRDEKAAAELVDYIARRSGLLLPRGPGQLAFAHLSVQEYFTACYFAEQLKSPLWPRTGRTPDARVHEGLRSYANSAIWRETLIFLFETVADEPGWTEAIAEAVFDEGFQDLRRRGAEAIPGAVLLAHLAVDPHSGFSPAMRAQASEQCWQVEFASQAKLEAIHLWRYKPLVAKALLSAFHDDIALVWRAFHAAGAGGMKALSLSGTSTSDLTPLAELTALQMLFLVGTQVSDLTPLAKLTALQWLYLAGSRVSDLTPLAKLTALKALDLGGTSVSDLMPLAELTALERLLLVGTQVSDLTPLARLTALEALYLDGTPVSDLTPLAGLVRLERLWVKGTQVSDGEVRGFHNARKTAGLREVEIDR